MDYKLVVRVLKVLIDCAGSSTRSNNKLMEAVGRARLEVHFLYPVKIALDLIITRLLFLNYSLLLLGLCCCH